MDLAGSKMFTPCEPHSKYIYGIGTLPREYDHFAQVIVYDLGYSLNSILSKSLIINKKKIKYISGLL